MRKGSTLPSSQTRSYRMGGFLNADRTLEKNMAYAIEWPLERVGLAVYTVHISQ